MWEKPKAEMFPAIMPIRMAIVGKVIRSAQEPIAYGYNFYHSAGDGGVEDDFDVELVVDHSGHDTGGNGGSTDGEVGVDNGSLLGSASGKGGVEGRPVHEEENSADEGDQVGSVAGDVVGVVVTFFGLEEIAGCESEVGAEHVEDNGSADVGGFEFNDDQSFVESPDQSLDRGDHE